ncbi:hypothetical protein [Anabaena sp. CCY 0017]|uniref:hypothetical protein n=1 Tax=Anabaena sp. CCY 0017 TaxID=3103866 RepID=UPI0039C6FA0B
MKNLLVNLTQPKILLAILGVVTSIAGFQIWQHNKQEYEKQVVKQIDGCRGATKSAYQYIQSSKTLSSVYHAKRLDIDISTLFLEKPGVTSPFKPDKNYLLIYTTPSAVIPDQPRYDGQIFNQLSRVEKSPIPIIVTIKSIDAGKAVVNSVCSPKPFTVSTENLYEPQQKSDFVIPTAPFSMF